MKENERLVRQIENIGKDISDLYSKNTDFNKINYLNLAVTLHWLKQCQNKLDLSIAALNLYVEKKAGY